MAAGILQAPGTEFGPCADDACQHTDCAATRRMAASICHHCDEPIGFGVRFYRVEHPDYEEGRGPYVHALCEEKAIDEQ